MPVSRCRTLASASELRRGLEAERVMPRRLSGSLVGSWWGSPSPAEPRVTELPAFLRDVLQEPGASGGGALFRSWGGRKLEVRWHKQSTPARGPSSAPPAGPWRDEQLKLVANWLQL